MKKFLVCRKQNAMGCDYTIGCGMHFDFYESENKETLIQELLYPDGPDERSCALEGEFALSDLIIVDYEYVDSIDLYPYIKAMKDKDEADKLKQEKENDEAEFERLRKKLGK